MIYVICFIISALCVKIYPINLKINKKQININFGMYMFAILPAALAGIRAPNVGVDVRTYVISAFERLSTYNSIKSVFDYHNLELGYECYVYIVARLFSDLHWVHFFSALLILIGVYCFISNFKYKVSVFMAVFAFLCIYFNQSLNTVRQWMAMGIYMFAIQYILKGEKLKYFIFCFVATLFHSSAIVTFFIYIIYRFLINSNTKKERWKAVFVIIGVIFLVIALEEVMQIATLLGLLPSKYLEYFQNEEGQSSMFMQILCRLPLILGYMVFYKILIKRDSRNKAVFIFLLIDLIFSSILSSTLGYAGRISLYFGLWQIIGISQLYKVLLSLNNKNEFKFIIAVLFVGVLLIYWNYYYVIRGFSGTYPYSSDIITI